jgi:hypothetical protein
MTMTLEEFAEAATVRTPDEAADIRRRFDAAFLRADHAVGPRWGRLSARQRVSLARLWATVAGVEVVHLMWDPPVDGRPTHPYVGAFAVDAVLWCRVEDLERGVEWLPDDLYVFDETFTWSAIFTRETDVDGSILLLATSSAAVAVDV